MGLIGRVIGKPVGLAAEAIQHSKDKKAAAAQNEGGDAAARSASSLPLPRPSASRSRSPLSASEEKEKLRRADSDAPPPAYEQAVNPTSHPGEDEYDSSDIDEEEDEADWAREEVQAELEDPSTGEDVDKQLSSPHGVSKYVSQHVSAFPRDPSAALHRLEIPVIVPQRRPESRMRGFVRAYAPVLEESDVSQQAFLHFLDGFSAVIRNQKYFWVVNGAVGITGIAVTAGAFVPSLITQLAIPAIHWTVEGGRRAYESNAVNQYLDQMNESYFKERNLYALIMTYDPYSSKKAQQVSLEDNTIKAVAARDQKKLNNLHQSSGHATELQIPESAELVFPALEAAPDAAKKGAMSRAGSFARDYLDRRARVQFENENPDTKLSSLHAEKPSFASSIADPNHAMWQGGIVTILSGGKIPSRRQRRQGRREQRVSEADARGIAPRRRDERRMLKTDRRTERRDQLKLARKKGYTPLGFVKRNLGEHVVYLMILPYPTEHEFAEYEAEQARARAQKEHQRSS